MTSELQTIVDGQTVERVLLDGDLQKLTASQRVSYYARVCESLGFNPLTRPFEYIVLNGKLTLYAKREATEQLRKIHKVGLTIVARELVEETYIVTARALLPDGRTDESIGVKWLGSLKGDARANAMMTAETKAKRRVTLSICGLGMLDETEVADIPPPAVQPQPMGNYASLPAPPPPAQDPPEPEPEPPEGFVRIARIESRPTKNEHVTKYFVILSTGEQVSTINQFLVTLAQNACENKYPVKVETRVTRWGTELVSIKTDDAAQLPLEPPLTADDIPFLWLLPVLLSVGSYLPF